MVSSGYNNNDNNQRGLLFFAQLIVSVYTAHFTYIFLMKHSNVAASLQHQRHVQYFNANPDYLVDRSKVFLLCVIAIVRAVVLEQKNF